MEGDFRNLTAKVWANLDNPVKRYDFSQTCIDHHLKEEVPFVTLFRALELNTFSVKAVS